MRTVDYKDALAGLDENLPLSRKLQRAHEALRAYYASVDRIAVAIYDAQSDMLKTFAHSSGDDELLSHYQAKLGACPSLVEIRESRRPRVIYDLAVLGRDKPHSRAIHDQGYQASYTMPIFMDGRFLGFVFFNTYDKQALLPDILHHLDVFGHLVSLVVVNEIRALSTLLATLKTAKDIAHQRDAETGSHLDRMSHYSRIIARGLAEKYEFDDEFIEHVFIFAPLHDIGKIGVPDDILLKNGSLSAEEYRVMQTHVEDGRRLVDQLLENFGLEELPHVDLLRNIVRYHHEAIDGSGYSRGLSGAAIPIEARIVAVADVFDALTSRRPYKPSWPIDRAFSELRRLAGTVLDGDCVAALEAAHEEVVEVHQRFAEDPYG